jgi:hypothetical protein
MHIIGSAAGWRFRNYMSIDSVALVSVVHNINHYSFKTGNHLQLELFCLHTMMMKVDRAFQLIQKNPVMQSHCLHHPYQVISFIRDFTSCTAQTFFIDAFSRLLHCFLYVCVSIVLPLVSVLYFEFNAYEYAMMMNIHIHASFMLNQFSVLWWIASLLKIVKKEGP